MTLACWARVADVTVAQALMCIGYTINNNFFELQSANGGPLAYEDNAGVAVQAQATAAPTNNTWFHAAATFTSTTSRAAFLNGTNKGTDATLLATPAVDTTTIGCEFATGTPQVFTNGDIAEAAVWNITLSDTNVAELARGMSPMLVRPDALVAYWPLWGTITTEPDRFVGAFHLTGFNTPTQATQHPPTMIYPSRPNIYRTSPAPPAPPSPLTAPVLPLSTQWLLHRIDLKPRREEHS